MTFEATDILALIQGPDWVPDQWRVIRPGLRLRQNGVNVRWASNDDEVLQTDPERTVLVLPRQTGSDTAAIDRWLAERRSKVRAIVWDCDDLLWGPEMLEHLELSDFMQGHTREQLLHEGEMARYFARQCDGITTASEPLAELVRRAVDVPVVCVPNAIDTRWFRCQMAARSFSDRTGALTIGWCGGRRPERDVEPMAKAWGRIARRYPEVRFVVAAPVIPDVFYREIEDDRRIIRFGWQSWEDSPVLYQCSIGCVSVASTTFSRCKTAIKCWEFVTAGAAVVGSDVLYGDCLKHGGYVARTVDDWEHALSLLIERPDVREMSHAALLAHVEQHHSLDTQVHRWPSAYAQIVESMAGVTV